MSEWETAEWDVITMPQLCGEYCDLCYSLLMLYMGEDV